MAKKVFKLNIAAAKKSTERDSIFFDLKPDTSTRIRVLPPTDESGNIFTAVTNHFNLKDAENRGCAVACLKEHGDGEEDCLLCRVTKALYTLGDTGDKTAAAMAKKLNASTRWYVQGLVYDRTEDSYFGPKLIGLSRKTANTVVGLLAQAQETNDDFFTDPDNGQDLVIMREGSGLKTRYTPSLNGKKAKLDDIFPDWDEKIVDPTKEVRLNVLDEAGQRDLLRITFGDELDVDALLAD